MPPSSVPPDFPCRLAYAWQLGRIGPDFGSRLIATLHCCRRAVGNPFTERRPQRVIRSRIKPETLCD